MVKGASMISRIGHRMNINLRFKIQGYPQKMRLKLFKFEDFEVKLSLLP